MKYDILMALLGALAVVTVIALALILQPETRLDCQYSHSVLCERMTTK